MHPGKRSFFLLALFFAILQGAVMADMVMAAEERREPENIVVTGEGKGEVITETEVLFEEREGYVPKGEYMDQEGKQYWLKEWHLEPYKIPARRENAERTVLYEEVEWEEQIPKQATVTSTDKVTGQRLQKDCPVLQKRFERERWIPDFKFTAVFHSYDADYYQLGTKKVPYNSHKPELEDCEPELLAEIGVKPENYRILHAAWKGDSYFDENGILCREAEITGEKKVADHYVTYGGEMVFPEAFGVKSIAVYRGFDSVTDDWDPAEERSVRLEDFHAGGERKKEVWRVIRKSIVITLSIMLAGGVIFLLIFLVRKIFRKKNEQRS